MLANYFFLFFIHSKLSHYSKIVSWLQTETNLRFKICVKNYAHELNYSLIKNFRIDINGIYISPLAMKNSH